MTDIIADFQTLTSDIRHPTFQVMDEDTSKTYLGNLAEQFTSKNMHLPYYLLRYFDTYTSRHAVHISRLSMFFTQQNEAYFREKLSFDPSRMLMETISGEVAVAGLLHDIGKLKVDPSIIYKEDALDVEEWAEMKCHSDYGLDVVDRWDMDLSIYVERGILDHHERYDGSGYPNAKSGNEISMTGQILALCDVYGALTEQRPYREANNPLKAIVIMKKMMDGETPFNPGLFDRFVETIQSAISENAEREFSELPDGVNQSQKQNS